MTMRTLTHVLVVTALLACFGLAAHGWEVRPVTESRMQDLRGGAPWCFVQGSVQCNMVGSPPCTARNCNPNTGTCFVADEIVQLNSQIPQCDQAVEGYGEETIQSDPPAHCAVRYTCGVGCEQVGFQFRCVE